MFKNYTFIAFFLLLFSFVSKAQNSIIISKIEGSLCAGTDISVSYTTQGTFNTGNKFKVQYRNANQNLWFDLVTTSSVSPLTVSLPKLLDKFTTYNDTYYFRIVSSSPIVEGNSSGYVSLKTIPNIILNPRVIAPLNPYEVVNLSSSMNVTFPIEIVMSDSTKIKLNNESALSLYPEKSGDYFVAKISNVCGVGTASGKVSIKVNQVGIKLNNISSTRVCHNGVLNVGYTTLGTFAKDNFFTIRLTEVYSNGRSFDFKATEKEGIISAIITNKIPADTYKLTVLGSSPEVTSPVGADITVGEAASVEVTTESSSISFGEKKSLGVTFRGIGPFYAKLNDGVSISYNVNYGTTYTNGYEVSPEKTTQYFIESFTSGCGNGVGANKATITVKEGIRTDSLPANKQVCSGETIKIPIKSNVILKNTDKFIVRFSANNYSSYDNSCCISDVEGKLLSDNLVECTIPTDFLAKVNITSCYLKVFTSSISGVYSPNKISVYDKPFASLYTYNETITSPQDLALGLNAKGGGITNIVLNDSLNYTIPVSINYITYPTLQIRVNKTTEFKLKSITNICGTTILPTNNSKTYFVTNPIQQSILLKQLPERNYCGGNKIKIDFTSLGIFNSNNEFNVDILNQYGEGGSSIGKTKNNSIEVTLPSPGYSGLFRIRVNSTNPLIYSNSIICNLQTTPSGTYTISDPNLNSTILIGQVYNEYINFNGFGPFEIEMADGSIRKIPGDDGSFTYYSNVGWAKAKDVFGVKSVKNTCGVGNITSLNKLRLVPYILSISSNYTYNLCPNPTVSISTNKFGNNLTKSSYSIQISNYTDTLYTTIQRNITSNIANFTIPETYKSGIYNIRILSEDSLNIKSPPILINFNKLPSATLTTNRGTDEETILGGESGTNLLIKSSESSNWSFGIMDDKNQRYSIQNISGLSFNNFVNPLQTTTYTLKTISSQCGYGIAKGSVKVIVKPNAKLNINNSNFITACIGDEVTLNLISFGTFEKDNKFSIVVYDDSTKKKEILSTPEAGSFKVKLPSDLQIGTYQVELSSSNPVSKKIVQSINITSSPEAILSGGGAIINAGERVNLLCTINPSQKTYIYENIQYQLSDTTSGTIYNQGKNYIQTKPLYSSKTFTLTSVRNICGAGKVSGSVKIEVNPPSAKQVNIDNYYTNYSYFCEGAEAYIYFTTKGNFTTNNKFTVQLSDAKGENFKDIKTEGNSNPLKALIPADLPVGAEYRFRIVASDKDVTSTTNLYPLEIRKGVTARFDTTAYYFEPNKPVTVKIIFTGTAPYGFTLGSDEINAKQFNANSSPYLLTVNPISSVSYKIFRVANSECGIGTILPQNTVTLQLITSIEELSEMGINVFPNPTSDILKIESNGKTEIMLFDIAGKIMLAKSFNSSNEELNLQNLPTGQYLLRVQKGNKMATFKVMKN